MERHIKILLIEDDLGFAHLIKEMLSESNRHSFEVIHAGKIYNGIELLKKEEFDAVLTDLGLPDSRGLDTFITLHSSFPKLPFIVLTGFDDEETAAKAVHEGAQDYLFKGEINSSVIVRSILYAIERQRLLNEVKALRGLLPICANCKKIRDDKGYWTQIEAYISKHSDAKFTHGLCPECVKKLYPELAGKI